MDDNVIVKNYLDISENKRLKNYVKPTILFRKTSYFLLK